MKRKRYFAAYPEKPFLKIGEICGWEVLLMEPREGADLTWMNLRVMSVEPREHKSVFRLAWSRDELRFARTDDSRTLQGREDYVQLDSALETLLRSMDWESVLSKM